MFTKKVFALLCFVMLVACDPTRQKIGISKKEHQSSVGQRIARNEIFDNLFTVYDPLFLAVIWPKITNGLHILVDYSCWDELGVFFRDLSDGRAWTYTALDASGRYESALISGNRYWLGSKAQCCKLDEEAIAHNTSRDVDDAREWKWVFHSEPTQKPVVSELWPPYRLAYTTLDINLNITKPNIVKSYNIVLGVCLPRSCSAKDISSVIHFSTMINDNLKTNRTTAHSTKISSVRQVPGSYNIAGDTGAILLICVTVFLAVVTLTATTLDLNLIKCLPYSRKSMTFDLEKYNLDKRTHLERHFNNGIDLKSDIDSLGRNPRKMKSLVVESMTKGLPAITQDVTSGDRIRSTSCDRCGKYRKQCSSPSQSNRSSCPKLQYNSIVSLSTMSEGSCAFRSLLLCFSISYCWQRVFNTNTSTKDLALIHGLRIVATLWIIFLHVALAVDYIADDTSDINDRNNIYYTVATGTIAFDTLFFVSGLFSAHHFFYLKSQYSVEELVGWDGGCGHLMQFICFVINRVIRLLPSYSYVVLLSGVVARWSRALATLALPDGDHVNCDHYWWRNLFYVNTMFPQQEQCLQVSWYLSTETQMHMLGAMLCAVSAAGGWRARGGVALALLAALTASVVDASAAYLDFAQIFPDGFHLYNVIVERPWARVAPYFLGILTGWLVHNLQGKLKVSKVTSSLLWMSSLSFILASVAVSAIGLPWLAAWLHLLWPIALLWPVVVGTTSLAGVFRRTLGNSLVAAVSRLCYGMILLHSAIHRAVLLSFDTTLCSHTICIWVYFAGTTILTLLAALLLSLLVEIPFCNLLRRISDCATRIKE